MYRQHEHQSTSAERGCKKEAVNSESNQFIGVSHGGKTTKIHAIVDALRNPVHFLLTGGNIFDASAAIDLLSEVNISSSNILGDKAYGTKSIRAYIAEQGASYTIPSKSNVVEPWFCDFHGWRGNSVLPPLPGIGKRHCAALRRVYHGGDRGGADKRRCK